MLRTDTMLAIFHLLCDDLNMPSAYIYTESTKMAAYDAQAEA